MKIKTLLIIAFAPIVFFPKNAYSQNIFPVQVDGCHLSAFCLDCGAPKAGYDSLWMAQELDKIGKSYMLKGMTGGVRIQVLVDSAGNGCVVSHTDKTKNTLTLDLIKDFNNGKWVAAMEKKKPVNSSIAVTITVDNGKLSASITRFGPVSAGTMKNPGTPKIYNKNYTYFNPSLPDYVFTVWQKENSDLPTDMDFDAVADQSGTVWCGTMNGAARQDGNLFTVLTPANSPFKADANVDHIAVDQNNNKWFSCGDSIFRYDGKKWDVFDSTKTGVKGAYHIVANASGELFFCAEKGLAIYKNGRWELINQDKIKQLPSNRVYYAFRDKRGRIWIGTFKGSIMMDGDKITSFNDTDNALKNICISGAAEDENGNIYFVAYAFNDHVRNSDHDGIIKLSADGQWTHMNDLNSGLPANTINSILYDKFDKLLWIGTNEAGLVRYDLKDGWEDYHNQNSKIPSTYIFGLSQDSSGAIYVATYYGIVRLKKMN